MRKVLIIFLILTVTSLTHAAVTWTITDDGVGNITASVIDNPDEQLFLIMVVDSDGVLSDFAKGVNAPSDSMSIGTPADNTYGIALGYLGQGEVWMMTDNTVPYIYNDGDWLTADFTFAAGKTSSVVSLYTLDIEGSEGEEVLVDSLVIPEPMTLSLLAFGGLFLRRRR